MSDAFGIPQKINALRGLSMKMKAPQSSMAMFKSPKLVGVAPLGQVGSRVKRETDPDYLPQHKAGLTGKLY